MTDYDPAPTELLDGDEWSEVLATQDYVGQSAQRFEMSHVEVRGGRWSGVTFEGLRAFELRFAGCDLAGVVLEGEVVLRNVAFAQCRLSGAVFAGAQLHNVAFEDCSLDDVNLRMVSAQKVSFSGCNLVAADFQAAALEDVRMHRCDLRGADFGKARMRAVDLRGSELSDLRGADSLSGATVDSAQVIALARGLAQALEIAVVDEDPDDS
ncbi:MAG TPA: pentapeptide repeat-containing protein [Acidimicrobiales bacterium]|nr:pentapeptide repeat-containing protein [Acidimicrobiales bacterium]